MWPVMHPCGIATVGCGEYDNSTFDQEGMIRRQCTKDGLCNTSTYKLSMVKVPSYIEIRLCQLRRAARSASATLHTCAPSVQCPIFGLPRWRAQQQYARNEL